MSVNNNFERVFLKYKEEGAIRAGFPWAFYNEVKSLEDCKKLSGKAVELYSASGLFLGTGFVNGTSKILVRLISGEKPDLLFDSSVELHTERCAKWFLRRVDDAYKLRAMCFETDDSFRLIFAEADFIPGLIADMYRTTGNKVCVVVQFLSLFAETFRSEIIAALQSVISPDMIYERSEGAPRTLEGLEVKTGLLNGTFPPAPQEGGGGGIITIKENGCFFNVNIERGQKTGFFLDQKFNRAAAARLAGGRTVFDGFCHTAGFAINTAAAGAASVLACDSSEEALERAKENIHLNNLDSKITLTRDDVFEALRRFENDGTRFDMVILDPPPFAKSARDFNKSYGAYKEINLRAIKILNPGGILITCSCSHYCRRQDFLSVLNSASNDAKRRIQIIDERGASSDHPVLSGYENSEYLNCVFAAVSGG